MLAEPYGCGRSRQGELSTSGRTADAAANSGNGCWGLPICARMPAMTEPHMETAMLLEPENLVGTWRRFGPVGPVYEIIGLGQELPEHDRMMRVRVVETGEEVDYRLTDILNDPLER